MTDEIPSPPPAAPSDDRPLETSSAPTDQPLDRAVEASTPPPESWHWTKKAGFRFLASYFVLYTVPFPLSYIPVLGGYPSMWVHQLWLKVVPWVAEHVLGLDDPVVWQATGSGDTTFAFVQLFVTFVLAAVVAVVWSVLDRRRPHYRRAARWLEVGVAFYLGLVMLSYGFAKVIPTQFVPPSLVRLLTPYGDSSPMGIVWTFMGLSPAYTIFAGLGEVVGALLVCWKRTRTLGAAVLTGVMTNVVMLNYAYDVPVKLYSSHLLVMAVGLLLLDARRLGAVILTAGPAPAAQWTPLFRRRWARITGVICATLLVGFVVYMNVTRTWSLYNSYGAGRTVSSLYGIYDVESFELGGEERQPLLTDDIRWRRLVVDRLQPLTGPGFNRPGRITLQQMDGTFAHRPAEHDEAAATLTITQVDALEATEDEQDAAQVDVLRYERPEPDVLLLTGTWQGEPVTIRLVRFDHESFELTGRGFHWVNETPRNR